jgi:hypothetical protein
MLATSGRTLLSDGGPALTDIVGPDPRSATTPAEFVARMRQLKTWSGLGFKQLESRAVRAGHQLPHSTLSANLSRAALPRPELLDAFVRACGCDDATTAHWLEACTRIAISEAGTPGPMDPVGQPAQLPAESDALPAESAGVPAAAAGSVPAGPAGVPGKGARSAWRVPRLIGAALGVLGAIAVGTVGTDLALRKLDPGATNSGTVTFVDVASTRSAPPRRPAVPTTQSSSPRALASPTIPLPTAGWFRLRPNNAYKAKLCLGVQATSTERLVLALTTCSTSKEQQFKFEVAGAGIARIRPRSTRFGANACVSVNDTSSDRSVHLRTCGDLHAVQAFTSERTRTNASAGPLIRFRPTAHPARCLGMPSKQSASKGAVLAEEDCSGASDQEFAVDQA